MKGIMSEKLPKYEHLVEMQEAWYGDRPAMEQNNTIEGLLVLLIHEVVEAQRELMKTNDPVLVARELADIGWFLMGAFRAIGQDMFTHMQEKMAYNQFRYDHKLFKNGTFHESRKLVKSREDQNYREFYAEPA